MATLFYNFKTPWGTGADTKDLPAREAWKIFYGYARKTGYQQADVFQALAIQFQGSCSIEYLYPHEIKLKYHIPRLQQLALQGFYDSPISGKRIFIPADFFGGSNRVILAKGEIIGHKHPLATTPNNNFSGRLK